MLDELDEELEEDFLEELFDEDFLEELLDELVCDCEELELLDWLLPTTHPDANAETESKEKASVAAAIKQTVLSFIFHLLIFALR